ncbi:hypothetical protein HFP66_31430 [Bacillus sp. A17A.1]
MNIIILFIQREWPTDLLGWIGLGYLFGIRSFFLLFKSSIGRHIVVLMIGPN